MGAFVGEERQQILHDLTERFERVVAERRPELLCLVAEAGWGKTRIVQELYRWLQSTHQPEGEYWPADLAPPGSDPMRTRKIIYPEQVLAFPDRPMPWLWWGLRCELDSGGHKLRAVINDGVQLRGHLGSLIAATVRKAENRELATNVLGETLALLPGVGQIASIAMAVKSLGPQLAQRLLDAFEAANRRSSDERQPRIVNSTQPAAPEILALVDLLKQSISSKLPLVLIVDDAHFADPATVDFLRVVLHLNIPALIVATAWPSELADQADEEREQTISDRQQFGGLLEALLAAENERVARVDLEPLSEGALARLVQEVAPSTNEVQQQALISTSGGNPLVLRLNVTSPKVQRSIRDDAITLSAEELGQMPSGFERIIRERFEHLADPERRWLSEAALQGNEFLPAYVEPLSDALDMEQISAFVRLPKSELSDIGRFIETPVHRVIAHAATEELSEAERMTWRDETLAALQERGCEGTEAKWLRWRLLLQLVDEPGNPTLADPKVLAEAAYQLSFVERDAGRHDEELRLAEAALAWSEGADVAPETAALYAVRRAAALRAHNCHAEAVAAARRGVMLTEQLDPSRPSDEAGALYVLATALLQNQEVAEAEQVARRALGAAQDDEDRLLALEILASIAEEGLDDAEMAKTSLEEALEVVSRIEPFDAEAALELEVRIADLEPFPGTVANWDRHAANIEKRIGRGNPIYVYCATRAALCLMAEANMEEIEKRLEEVDEIGTDDADEMLAYLRGLQALLTRGDLTVMRQSIGELSTAPYSSRRSAQRMEMLGLLIDGEKGDDLLGGFFDISRRVREDPDGGLAWLALEMREKAMQWSVMDQMLAANAAVGLLMERMEQLGRPSPSSRALMLEVRNIAADHQAFPALSQVQINIYTDAEDLFNGCKVKEVDWSLPHALAIRAVTLRAIGAGGAGDQATADSYLEQARKKLEPEDNYKAWTMVAVAHERCGSREAAAVWEQLANLPSLDRDKRLTAQAYAASWLYREGRYEEAESLEREVLRERLRFTDASDSAVQLAQLNLAATLLNSDQAEEARDLYRAVADARSTALGDTAQPTAEARYYLARAMIVLGERREALPMLEAVVDNLSALPAEAHPPIIPALELLARLYGELEELKKSEEAWADVHERRLEVEAAESLEAMVALGELTNALLRQERFEDARTRAEELATARLRTSGPDDPASRMAQLQLASALKGIGNLEEAGRIELEVAASREKTLGPSHPLTLDALQNLAVTLYRQGDLEGAGEIEQQIFELRLEEVQKAQVASIRAGEELVATLAAAGDEEGATRVLEIVVRQRGELEGWLQPEAMRAVDRLIQAYVKTDEIAKARSLAERAAVLRQEGLPQDHPAVKAADDWLVKIGELEPNRDPP